MAFDQPDALLDPRDAALQAAFPTLMAPRYGVLPPLAAGGRRHILASDGLYVEARSHVLHVCLPLMRHAVSGMPYGDLKPFVKILSAPMSPEMMAMMVARARAVMPNEWAGLLIRDGDGLRLHEPPTLSASAASIRYVTGGWNPLDLLVDVHSHGRLASHFSDTDDRDDRMNPAPCFFAMVIGRLDAVPEVTHRLVVNRHFFVRVDEQWQLDPTRAAS